MTKYIVCIFALTTLALFISLKFSLSVFLRIVPNQLIAEYRISGVFKRNGKFALNKVFKCSNKKKEKKSFNNDELLSIILDNVFLETLSSTMYVQGQNLASAVMYNTIYSILLNTLLGQCRQQWEKAELSVKSQITKEQHNIITAYGKLYLRGYNLIIIALSLIAYFIKNKLTKKGLNYGRN